MYIYMHFATAIDTWYGTTFCPSNRDKKSWISFFFVFPYGSVHFQCRKNGGFLLFFLCTNICINWFSGFEWISIHSVFSFFGSYYFDNKSLKWNHEVANEWPCHQTGLREASNVMRSLWLEQIGCEFNYSN